MSFDPRLYAPAHSIRRASAHLPLVPMMPDRRPSAWAPLIRWAARLALVAIVAAGLLITR